MEDPHDLQSALSDAIRDNVGPSRHDPFASPWHASLFSHRWKFSNLLEPSQDRLDKFMGSFWIFFGNVSRFVVKVPEGCPQPLNLHWCAIYQRQLLPRQR